jgi:hypothetical protein
MRMAIAAPAPFRGLLQVCQLRSGYSAEGYVMGFYGRFDLAITAFLISIRYIPPLQEEEMKQKVVVLMEL